MRKIERVSIIGMGALGILYGEFIAEAVGADVVNFLADEKRVEKFNQQGAYCNGKKCIFSMKDVKKDAVKPDLLIFAVKATALAQAVELAKDVVDEDTIILSILNGISSEEYIKENLGKGTVITCVAQGMDAVKEENRLTYSHMGVLCIGLAKGEEEKQPQFDAVKEFFERCKLPYVEEPDILRRLWCKWMLNVGVNQTVMVYEGTYATIQQPGEARDRMRDAMGEVILIAEKEGIHVTDKDRNEYMALTDTLSPEGMPSMRQDGLARRKSEVELFAGTVLKKAAKYGVNVPVNQKLYEQIQEIEATY